MVAVQAAECIYCCPATLACCFGDPTPGCRLSLAPLLALSPLWLPLQVDVVGVDGELKEIAMKALNTRANFAYSQKEVQPARYAVFCSAKLATKPVCKLDMLFV